MMLTFDSTELSLMSSREMQLFLIGYIIIEICEIFSIGGFPLPGRVRRAFSAAHIAAVVATTWILLMNGAVGYQLLYDGTLTSMLLIFGSAAALFIGTGYIALDTGFSWTGYWNSSLTQPNQAYALYTLYFLVPLVFLFLYFVLESILVLRVLKEVRPMCKSGLLSDTAVIPLADIQPLFRLSRGCCAPICYRTGLPIRHQRTHLYRLRRQDQWRILQLPLHVLLRHHDLGFLVKHYGGRLAHAGHIVRT